LSLDSQEREFWIQRQGRKIRDQRQRTPAETKGPETRGANPRTNGLSEPLRKISSSEGLGGGDSRYRTGCPPRSHRNQSSHGADTGLTSLSRDPYLAWGQELRFEMEDGLYSVRLVERPGFDDVVGHVLSGLRAAFNCRSTSAGLCCRLGHSGGS
jgi:hypothetical protein